MNIYIIAITIMIVLLLAFIAYKLQHKKYENVAYPINKIVIVRADRAGVFFGTLVEKKGDEVRLTNCRRIWYWNGAASLSELATHGTSKAEDCKFTVSVSSIVVEGVIEIIPCTDEAIKNINSVKEWKMSE